MFPTKSRVLTLVAAALLLTQGIYGLVACWLESNWGSAQFCVVAIIAGLGVAYRRWWSRPLVVALVLLLLSAGIWFGWRTAAAGLFRNRKVIDISLMLLPAVGYLGLSIFCAYVAVKHVPGRKRPSQNLTIGHHGAL
jgi:membrane associated rhomboid family serine protease